MFCDMVGSTALAARLDPEDLREVIGAYHRAVAEVVAGFDGFVAKYMGDGVLIYFGYPRAHDRREERHFCLPQRRSSAFDGTGVAELLHTAALNIIGGAISATIKTFPFR
jgi:class 3 adenylate cyclase